MKLELVDGYKEATNEVILGLCLTYRNEVIETLSVLISVPEAA